MREALAEYHAGRWAEARALFRRAHRIEPTAQSLRGMAMTSFELREYPTAIAYCGQALRQETSPLSEAHRAHVEELRERAGAFVGRFRIEGEGRARVDGVPVDPEDGWVLVGLGAHTLEFVVEGETFERRVQVEGGERETFETPRLEVAPMREEPVASAIRASPALDVPDDPSPLASVDHTLAHALLTAAAVLAAASVVPAAAWINGAVQLETCAASPCSNEPQLRLERDAGAVGAVLTWAAMASLATSGIVLLTLHPEGAPRASIRLGLAARGGTLEGVF